MKIKKVPYSLFKKNLSSSGSDKYAYDLFVILSELRLGPKRVSFFCDKYNMSQKRVGALLRDLSLFGIVSYKHVRKGASVFRLYSLSSCNYQTIINHLNDLNMHEAAEIVKKYSFNPMIKEAK